MPQHGGVRKKLIANLDPRIASASVSLIASFPSGIIQDKPAVRAALTEPWSNGQTEGQITKLKLVSQLHQPRPGRMALPNG
jgi:transposase